MRVKVTVTSEPSPANETAGVDGGEEDEAPAPPPPDDDDDAAAAAAAAEALAWSILRVGNWEVLWVDAVADAPVCGT